jgi:hypothetical protein
MATATSMYALGLDQIANLIVATGTTNTVLAQGHMGTGKSALLHTIGEQLPDHRKIYFDCTTKDLGDLMIPRMKDAEGGDYVSFATNEELGLHIEGPVIIMIDEFGKANPAVKNGLTRLMYERQMGSYKLHPDSIVFATTNLGAEGVGDMMAAHHRNRITVVTVRKPSHIEWIEWGINNDIDHSLLGWVRDNPQAFATFEDVSNPDDNQYIFHPKAQRVAFVTPRSLEKFSNVLRKRHLLDDNTVVAAGIGTVGERAAMDIMAFTKMADQLPSLQSIKDSPSTAKVPTSAAAMCMVIYRTLGGIDREWLDAWMTYLPRLSAEAQGMFANGVRAKTYNPKRQTMIMTNKAFTRWAMDNNHLFGADV